MLNPPGGNGDNVASDRIHAQGTSDLRRGRFSKFCSSVATAVSDLMGVEPAHAHEEFVGQQEIADFIDGFDGANDLHQEDEYQLNERDIFSLLLMRVKMFQKWEYIDFPEVIEEGVKQGGLVHGIDHIHLTMMEQVICDDCVIPFGGMPEKTVAESFLELVAVGHGGEVSTKRGGCQVGSSIFI